MPSTPGSTAVSVPAGLCARPPASVRWPGRPGWRGRTPARAQRLPAQERSLSLVWVWVGGGPGQTPLLLAVGQLCASAPIASPWLPRLSLEPDASPIDAVYVQSDQDVPPFDRAGEDPTAAPTVPETILSLDEPEFAAAAREALRHLTSPDVLARNPLVRSQMVAERAGGEAGIEARVEALQALVQAVVTSLGASPRRAKLQRALHHTYIEPAGGQEQVAELLDLPFSTYRDHLKAGIQLVGEILWHREIGRRVRPALEPSASPAHPAAPMST